MAILRTRKAEQTRCGAAGQRTVRRGTIPAKRSLGWTLFATAGVFVCACTDGAATASQPSSVHAAAEVRAASRSSWGPPAPTASITWSRLELARDPDASPIADGWAASDAELRRRAAWALARIGPVHGLAERFALAIEARALPADAFAAVGLLERSVHPSAPWQRLERTLWSRYAVTEHSDEAEALLFAVARVGGEASQKWLAADVEVIPEVGELGRYHAAMRAMGILCTRGFSAASASLAAIANGLQSSHAVVRSASAYALGRCAVVSAEHLVGETRLQLAAHLEALVSASAHDQGDDESHLVWKAFAALGEVPATLPAAFLQPVPSWSWQAEVEAARALASHVRGREPLIERLVALDLEQLTGARAPVVLAAARALRDVVVGQPELVERLEPLRTKFATAQRPEATARERRVNAILDCEFELLRAIVARQPGAVEDCHQGADGLPPHYGRMLAVEGLLSVGTSGLDAALVDRLLAYAGDPDPKVAERALGGLATVSDQRAIAALHEALGNPDVGVQTAATVALATRAGDKGFRGQLERERLIGVLRTVDNATAIEARLGAIDGLAHLADPTDTTDETATTAAPWVEEVLLPLAHDPAYAVRAAAREALSPFPALLERFDARLDARVSPPTPALSDALQAFMADPPARVRVHTSAGAFEISFADGDAPIAQANFAELARSGFYEGVAFHRIVPGFVVQGGDPRADGYGGPGYLVPCEWSNARYERGVVGMALAGKDTGGSQFFIAHTEQPHLDGRYTVIGHVTSGMDVVDRLLPFDTIERMEVLADSGRS